MGVRATNAAIDMSQESNSPFKQDNHSAISTVSPIISSQSAIKGMTCMSINLRASERGKGTPGHVEIADVIASFNVGLPRLSIILRHTL